MENKNEVKDLNYYKNNCEEDYLQTPISVLRYISQLESALEEQNENKRFCWLEMPKGEFSNSWNKESSRNNEINQCSLE